jgi:hypothetical protein
MKRLLIAAVLMIGTAPVMAAEDVLLRDGVEYLLRFGRQPRPGWSDGLKYSDQTRIVCQHLMGSLPPPVVCMVRDRGLPI